MILRKSPNKRRNGTNTLATASSMAGRGLTATRTVDASTFGAAACPCLAMTAQTPSKTDDAGLAGGELTPESGRAAAQEDGNFNDKRRRLAPPEQPCFTDPPSPTATAPAAAPAAPAVGALADGWERQLPSEVGVIAGRRHRL